MSLSISVCIASLLALLLLLRHTDRLSLGLPLAYLYLLLLNHVPGALAHEVDDGRLLEGSDATAIGIFFTAIGSVCFVVGVWLARRRIAKASIQYPIDREAFARFCLIGGWAFTYGLAPLRSIPSLGAAIEKGGAVWMLGIMLGLRSALLRRDPQRALLWMAALAVYPILMLLLRGFVSYGAAAVIIVLAITAISTASLSRVILVASLTSFLGVSVFVNYFANRTAIRDAVWGGAPMEQRIDTTLNIFRGFEWLDLSDPRQLTALHERLNQNYFVGVAAERLKAGEVGYLYGQSIWEGIIALVPRAIWPDKPVFAGSPKIVMEMTGLQLNEDTSWGVGNVMEFYINYGIPGLVIGFVALGWLLGTLDRKAAEADRRGDFKKVIIFFLPAVALIQPIGSMVELASGAAAAVVASYGWGRMWGWWSKRKLMIAKQSSARF